MKFQVYSKLSLHRHMRTGAPLDPPHTDAFFDEELQGWVIDVRDLSHLCELSKDMSLQLGSTDELPVLVFLDEAANDEVDDGESAENWLFL